MLKHSHTETSQTKNYSQKLQLQQLKRNKVMLVKAVDMLQNPFDPKQVSRALKFLENQTQRKELLDEIIGIREQRRRKQEFEKMSSMRGILTKVSKRFAGVKNTEIKFSRDFNDFKILQEERNKMEKLQYENLNLQCSQRKSHLRRMSSLNFLTRDIDSHKFKQQQSLDPFSDQLPLAQARKTQRNASLLMTFSKQIPNNLYNSERRLPSPSNCLKITQETDQE